MTRQCLDKNIKITPVEGRLHVIFDEAEIVSTLNALEVDEPGEPKTYYVPRADVQPGILEASETRTACAYKGEAYYYTLKTLTCTGPDQVKYYPEPCPGVGAIRDMLTFEGDRIEIRRSQV